MRIALKFMHFFGNVAFKNGSLAPFTGRFCRFPWFSACTFRYINTYFLDKATLTISKRRVSYVWFIVYPLSEKAYPMIISQWFWTNILILFHAWQIISIIGRSHDIQYLLLRHIPNSRWLAYKPLIDSWGWLDLCSQLNRSNALIPESLVPLRSMANLIKSLNTVPVHCGERISRLMDRAHSPCMK